MPSTVRTPSAGTHTNVFEKPEVAEGVSLAEHRLGPPHELGVIASGDEADTDGEIGGRGPLSRGAKINYRDFENEKVGTSETRSPEVKPKKKAKKKHRKTTSHDEKTEQLPERITESHSEGKKPAIKTPSSPRVGLVQSVQIAPDSSPKRPFNIRALSRPALPNLLTPTVFSSVPPSGPPVIGPGAPTNMPRALNGVRRTTSLPDRLNQTVPTASAPPLPYVQPINASHVSIDSSSNNKATKNISPTTAVVLLLVSTGLVAICAEFLVGSINYLVDNTGVSEAFVGLIILPIVGNAAEHVTAVTVASKNKMDLAIGVAVGSSIQIGKRSPIHLFVLPLTWSTALFVTPVIVLLGWILTKDMSLYFSLFETVSLFVSAFIVNFLVLDGRSNYLEGALLIAAYIIIAVAAFFYPDSSQQSPIGGAEGHLKLSKMF